MFALQNQTATYLRADRVQLVLDVVGFLICGFAQHLVALVNRLIHRLSLVLKVIMECLKTEAAMLVCLLGLYILATTKDK